MHLDMERSVAAMTAEVGCPHLAMLIHSPADVPAAQASFYSLGLKRRAWVLHHTLPGRGDADRAALTAAGLDVAALEAAGRLTVSELPLRDPPESWALPFRRVLEDRLAAGFEAVWWSRFPLGADDRAFARAFPYDVAWDEAFSGRPAVSLCLYVVGDLGPDVRADRVQALAAIHDGVLVDDDGEVELAGGRRAPSIPGDAPTEERLAGPAARLGPAGRRA
jgi:hypothetical protein